MRLNSVFQRVSRRARLAFSVRSPLRRAWLRLHGAQIGLGTRVPRLQVTWPHQIAIGRRCVLEDDIFFKFDGAWCPGPSITIGDRSFVGRGSEMNIRAALRIGDDCLIASGCKFIDHDHGSVPGTPMNRQEGPESPIRVEDDVWLGVNVVVLKGVTIGKGAVVGAGAVVTKSVPPYEIWVGVPARRVGTRAGAGCDGLPSACPRVPLRVQ